MDFRCFPILFSLNLILMAAHAALPPQIYWERMLPTTLMPKPIIELLNHGGFFITEHMVKATNDNQKVHSKDGNPFSFDGVNKNEPSQETHLEDLIPLYGKKSEPSQKTRLEDLLIYGKKSEPSQKTHLEDELDVDKVTIDDQEGVHQLHYHSKRNSVFKEKGLRPGSKLVAHFYKKEHTSPLLPRHVAQRIPFSSDKVREILDIFSVEPGSQIAENVGKALWHCETPPSDDEEKYCATSLESMVDFVISMYGNNIGAMSTEVEKETKSKKFTVKDGVKKLADQNVIGCHPLKYPYMVFYCHLALNSTAHLIPLEGEDGARVKAIAVCHKDTSDWDPNHVAFQILQIKPGEAPVCHIFPQDHLIFAK